MAQKRPLAVEGEGGEAPEKRRSWRDVSKPFLSKDSRDGPTPFDVRNCSLPLSNLLRSPHVKAITKTGLLLLPLDHCGDDPRSVFLDERSGFLWRVEKTDAVGVGYTYHPVRVYSPFFMRPQSEMDNFTDDAIMAQSSLTTGFRDLLSAMCRSIRFFPFPSFNALEKAAAATPWEQAVTTFLDECAEDENDDGLVAVQKLLDNPAYDWLLKRILVFFETRSHARLAYWLETSGTLERDDFKTTQGYLLYHLAICDGTSKYTFATLAHACGKLDQVKDSPTHAV